MQEHTTLVRTTWDPCIPPSFVIEDIGGKELAGPMTTMHLDGSWDKHTKMGGTGWSAYSPSMEAIHQQGTFLYASSALMTELKLVY